MSNFKLILEQLNEDVPTGYILKKLKRNESFLDSYHTVNLTGIYKDEKLIGQFAKSTQGHNDWNWATKAGTNHTAESEQECIDGLTKKGK
jgi:hypothetical protein